ncbi:MAG: NAD-dependent epimerase/dehydratase family protein [Halanaeroarchaeum sp.]
MRIAVTGAAGRVGRQALDALNDHDVTPITHRHHDDVDGDVLAIEDRDAVVDAIEGHDAVVHLAANPHPSAEWDELAEPNVEGTYNVYAAAAESGVERVVFASTNHTQQYHVFEDPADLGSLPERPDPITADDPFRPDSLYGVSKVAGEAMGSYFADRHGIEVVNLRIGWLLSREGLLDRQDGDEQSARFARALWLSPRDCRQGIRKAATESLLENPLDANLLSDNRERYFSLIEARRGFEFDPRDDSAAVVDDADG